MAALLRVGLLGTILFLFAFAIYVLYEAGEKAKAPLHTSITYAGEIAPLVYKHCSTCHRGGQPTPFSLLTFNDVAKRSLTIREIINKRIMPPWPADHTYTNFCEENYLTDEEIEMVNDWVDAGAPAGDLSKVPPAPDFPEGSMLGKPDLTLKLKPFLVKGDNTDRFMVMKLPYEFDRDTFIRAIEFVPGVKYIHHVNGRMIFYDDDKKKNVFGGQYVLDTKDETKQSVFTKMELYNDDGSEPDQNHYLHSVTNYLPGVFGTIYPEGIGGFNVKRKGLIYLNDIHYGPSPEDIWDSSYVNIFFGKLPSQRPTMEIQLGTNGLGDIIPPLVIPPDTVMTFIVRGKILNDISLLTINPHMHLLGKSFNAYALPPTGDTIPLIKINQWDFRWQYFYTFKKMLHIPAGSTIEVVAVMDNTTGNPNNPNHPPKEVEGRNGSMRSTDEMLQFIMTFLPYQKGDENIGLETNIR
ncbi:MAG: cytochrome c [Chitinophagales bacterium]|nr:cytochrome c [Chitinophagales bacterium]